MNKLNKVTIWILLFILFATSAQQAELNDEQQLECSADIVSKFRWGGRPPKQIQYQIIPLKYVIVHHTVTSKCDGKTKCANILANVQQYHMNELNYTDIAYNFMIGNDGRVYEGTGWHIQGSHTYGYNRQGLGIAFIGDFSDELPTKIALDSCKRLIRCGVQSAELDIQYKLFGGRQIISSESPGIELYGEIQEWDNWSAVIP